MGRSTGQHSREDGADAQRSDTQLVRSAQTDRTAFAPLYDRYFDTVYRFCYFRLGNCQDAEDASSDVFTRVLANLGRFRTDEGEDGFRCWLFAIARNIVTDYQRARTRHPSDSLELGGEAMDTSPTPEEASIITDGFRQMLALFARLKPNQRDLLELRLAGLTNAEIARILGRTHDAVRKEQSRIVQLLRFYAECDAEREVSNVR